MMAIVCIPIALASVVIFVIEYTRTKRLDYMVRAEKACARFGQIRHELVMAFSRGEIRPEDLKAFQCVHMMCTQVLHVPQFFREFTTIIFVAVAKDEIVPPATRLRPEDLSPVTRPFLERVVAELDGLIQQFAHPLLAALASVSDVRVLEFAVRLREARREVKRRRQQLEIIRKEGNAVLAA